MTEFKKQKIVSNLFNGKEVGDLIDEALIQNLSSELLFERFVASRIPVKIIGHISDENWMGDKWTNSSLRQHCGTRSVKVEYRKNGRFGQGCEENMKFSEFLDSLERGDNKYYLSTQELVYDEQGQPALISSPVDGLIGQFPWQPSMMGNLIPSNINLWLGSSSVPTTSGLHHDYHDNLYILLRGIKLITLISPKETENLYTVGKLLRVHPNGRINYEGQSTLADGSNESAIQASKASLEIENANKKLEEVN